MNDTGIQWAEKTWNPVTGCSRVSPGCVNCYAERMAHRLAGRVGYPADNPFRVVMRPYRLSEPIKMKKPSRIFVCSMSDLFHEGVTDDFLNLVFGVMLDCPQHTFMALTKRHTRMELVAPALPNVWWGVSAEDQMRVKERISGWGNIYNRHRFVSLEPLLGPLDLGDLTGISWVIVGGESGPGALECQEEWIADIVRQCEDRGVPVFVKQMGTHWAKQHGERGAGDNPEMWPPHLRKRQMPEELK